MIRVYICSPLRAGNGFTIQDNVEFAKKLCAVTTRAGYAAWASHVFYPLFLDDAVQKERELGMNAGLSWLRVCDELWVYAEDESECSEGMLREIQMAQKLALSPKLVWMPAVWKHVGRMPAHGRKPAAEDRADPGDGAVPGHREAV